MKIADWTAEFAANSLPREFPYLVVGADQSAEPGRRLFQTDEER